MAEKTKVKLVGTNKDYGVKANGLVTVKIECDGGQLPQVMRMFNFLGRDFKMGANLGEPKPIGKFSIWNIKVDGDGEATLILRSDRDSVKMDQLDELYAQQELVEFMMVG